MLDFSSLLNFSQLQHFHFLRPYWLIAFIVMLFILHFFSQRDDTLAIWRKVMSTNILHALTVPGNTAYWLSPQKLSMIIALPICLVLMGPTWQQQASPFSENNAPLVIALDVSKTMEQNDIQPSRLVRAKQKIRQLLALRGDTKTALIAFSGSAHIVMPLTNDQQMIGHFLDSLSEKIMPVSGKIPDAILPLTRQILSTSSVPGSLLMIGDGASEQSSEVFASYFQSKELLSANQSLIWAIGNRNSETDSNIIPLQIAQLKNLASKSHGRFIMMSADDSDVKQVNNYIKHNLITIDDASRPWLDAGYPLTFIIAGIFLFWFRKGWTLQW